MTLLRRMREYERRGRASRKLCSLSWEEGQLPSCGALLTGRDQGLSALVLRARRPGGGWTQASTKDKPRAELEAR